jgi:hypothetical protein
MPPHGQSFHPLPGHPLPGHLGPGHTPVCDQPHLGLRAFGPGKGAGHGPGPGEFPPTTAAPGVPGVTVAGMMNDRLPPLMGDLGELGGAIVQVAYTGSDDDVAEARQLLARTRRAIYRLLATEPEDGEQL